MGRNRRRRRRDNLLPPLFKFREKGERLTHFPIPFLTPNLTLPSLLFSCTRKETANSSKKGRGMRSEKGGGEDGVHSRESANNSQGPVPSPSFCSQRISGEKVRKSGKELRRRNFLPSPFSCPKRNSKIFPRLRLCHSPVPLTSPLLGITLLDTSIQSHLFLPSSFLPPLTLTIFEVETGGGRSGGARKKRGGGNRARCEDHLAAKHNERTAMLAFSPFPFFFFFPLFLPNMVLSCSSDYCGSGGGIFLYRGPKKKRNPVIGWIFPASFFGLFKNPLQTEALNFKIPLFLFDTIWGKGVF